MNPIFSEGRLRLYLAAWVPVGLFLTVLLRLTSERSWPEAAALALPLTLVHAFLCLGSWPLCRATPVPGSTFGRIAVAHGSGALLSSGLLTVLGGAWAMVLAHMASDPAITARYWFSAPLVFAVGMLLFVLTASVHYLLLAFETSRAAEQRALELQILARDARMKTLTAQVNPHFLFNALNAISGLAGSDPTSARTTCAMLAGYLRGSLSLGERERITLGDELGLVRHYLAIERVRFGDRLRTQERIGPGSLEVVVPPLLLQPLVENAVTHGIAHSIEGGTVGIATRTEAGRLIIIIDNPADAARPRRSDGGLGIANVRDRLATLYGAQGSIAIEEAGGSFRATLTLPAQVATGPTLALSDMERPA